HEAGDVEKVEQAVAVPVGDRVLGVEAGHEARDVEEVQHPVAVEVLRAGRRLGDQVLGHGDVVDVPHVRGVRAVGGDADLEVLAEGREGQLDLVQGELGRVAAVGRDGVQVLPGAEQVAVLDGERLAGLDAAVQGAQADVGQVGDAGDVDGPAGHRGVADHLGAERALGGVGGLGGGRGGGGLPVEVQVDAVLEAGAPGQRVAHEL